jgi:hypothetical protein
MYGIEMRPTLGRQIFAPRSFTFFHTLNRNYFVLLALLVLCLSSLGVSGCGGVVRLGGSPSESTTANLVATPSTLDFGIVSLGNSANQKVSVANKGSDPVQISQLSLSNTAFRVEGQGKLPATLAAGSTISFNVHFTPNDSKDLTGQLSVVTTDPSIPEATVSLHGKGSRNNAQMSGFSCDTAQMEVAGTDTCTVVTDISAPSGGLLVRLSSSIAAIKVPASVTVPAGATSVKFAATALKVSTEQTGTITATQGSVKKSVSISLSSPTTVAEPPALDALSCASTSFTAAGKTNCTVSLSAASSKALNVALATSSSAVSVPANITVAAHSTTASFAAKVAAVSKSQSVTISATANASSKSVAIQLKASKASAAGLNLSTSSLDFGNIEVGTSATKSVRLTSSGTAPVIIESGTITGTGFSVSGGSFPATLHPGKEMMLTLRFDPSAIGSVSGQFMVSSNAGTARVGLSGTGTKVAPAISALSCTTTSITGALPDSCKVVLSGSAPKGGLTVALASSSTKLMVPGSVTVPATATTAAFTVNAAAVSTAQSVKLTATAGNTSRSVSLQLNPALAQLSVNATSISFGAVVVNHATTQIVTLTSIGKAAVTVKSISVNGTGFSLSPVSLPATLNPGQTLLLTLTFGATTLGSHTGQLTITSDSSPASTVTIALSGTSNPHQVELSWNAPSASSAPIAQYKVYRANSGTGSFAKLSTVAQTTYTDTSVKSGQRYDYYVTSVGSSGAESTPSKTTTVSIP